MNPESESASAAEAIVPREGWHVIHLFYQIDQTQWSVCSEEERLEAKTRLAALVQEIRSTDSTQLLTFSVVTPKADLAFMLLTPDLHRANEFEKRLTVSLGPDILTPVYSYLSMTEVSEYTTTSDQYRVTLEKERGLAPDSDEFKEALEEFEKRQKRYTFDRLYPNLPDWPVFCFYNMLKRRGEQYNWYASEYEARRQLMLGHAKVGRTYAGRVSQLITGSTGLDDAEWGVSLFAHNSQDIKEIVYEMRFDEASSRYGEFGEFYIGMQLPLNELFARVGL